jgi:hypothetical protein
MRECRPKCFSLHDFTNLDDVYSAPIYRQTNNAAPAVRAIQAETDFEINVPNLPGPEVEIDVVSSVPVPGSRTPDRVWKKKKVASLSGEGGSIRGRAGAWILFRPTTGETFVLSDADFRKDYFLQVDQSKGVNS